jgi:hypothetical protein
MSRESRVPMIAAEGDEVQVVSAMPAFQTRRHTSSVEVVVARRSDHRHTCPVTDLALPGLEPRRDPGHPAKGPDDDAGFFR